MPCEILLRAVDKINPDNPRRSRRLLKRGDIVVVVPFDHEWSQAEQTNPEWRIIAFSNIGLAAAVEFLAEQAGNDFDQPYRWRRAKYLDIAFSQLPAGMRTYLADETRAVPRFVSSLSAAQVASAFADRPAPDDPGEGT